MKSKKKKSVAVKKLGQGHNATFGPGADWGLNACVGQNTGANLWEGYKGGFNAGAEVLLDAAGVAKPVQAGGIWALPNVDYLVYPICLCARHHIEISLKRAIPIAWEIFKIRSPGSNGGLQAPHPEDNRHGLMEVWRTLSTISEQADKRIWKHVKEARKFIKDFDAVDPSGMVFRYATDLNSAPHLDDLTHINLQLFAERYSAVCNTLEMIEVSLWNIREEYQTGSFTAELARPQLVAIAKALPAYKDWGTADFAKVKDKLISRYKLSSQAFSRALKKIKTTRALAVMVGIEEPIECITVDSFKALKKLAAGKHSEAAKLSKETLAALSGLLHISANEYPERFAWYSRPFSVENPADAELESARDAAHLARKISKKPRALEAGLTKLGQGKLVAQFKKVFP